MKLMYQLRQLEKGPFAKLCSHGFVCNNQSILFRSQPIQHVTDDEHIMVSNQKSFLYRISEKPSTEL